jgi:hypothetical protein
VNESEHQRKNSIKPVPTVFVSFQIRTESPSDIPCTIHSDEIMNGVRNRGFSFFLLLLMTVSLTGPIIAWNSDIARKSLFIY